MPAENVTQNLNFLIDAILDKNSESECDEWEEVCNYLTQKQETKEVEEGSCVELFKCLLTRAAIPNDHKKSFHF